MHIHLPLMIRHGPLDVAFAPHLPKSIQSAVLASLPDPAHPIIRDDAEVLKCARQRLVLRLPVADLPGGSCIAKLFPLRNPISRLKHRKYALCEYQNYLAAHTLRMDAPMVWAFFQHRRFGFVAGSGLLVEDLRHYHDVVALAAESGDYPASALAAIPALKKLYSLGINHVDARDENILIALGSEDGCDFRVIDWQYAAFCEPRADWLLEHLAAYFIRMAPSCERKRLLCEWLAALHLAAAPPILSLTALTNRVVRLLTTRPSTRARLALAAA